MLLSVASLVSCIQIDDIAAFFLEKVKFFSAAVFLSVPDCQSCILTIALDLKICLRQVDVAVRYPHADWFICPVIFVIINTSDAQFWIDVIKCEQERLRIGSISGCILRFDGNLIFTITVEIIA